MSVPEIQFLLTVDLILAFILNGIPWSAEVGLILVLRWKASTSHHYIDKRGENFSRNDEIFASQNWIIRFYSGKHFWGIFLSWRILWHRIQVKFTFDVFVQRSNVEQLFLVWVAVLVLALTTNGPSSLNFAMPNIVFQILSASTGLNNGHIRNMLKQLPNVRLVDLVTLYAIYFTLKFLFCLQSLYCKYFSITFITTTTLLGNKRQHFLYHLELCYLILS